MMRKALKTLMIGGKAVLPTSINPCRLFSSARIFRDEARFAKYNNQSFARIQQIVAFRQFPHHTSSSLHTIDRSSFDSCSRSYFHGETCFNCGLGPSHFKRSYASSSSKKQQKVTEKNVAKTDFMKGHNEKGPTLTPPTRILPPEGSINGVQPKIATVTAAPLSVKKRAKWRQTAGRKTFIDELGLTSQEEEADNFPITAYALCDEFDLKNLHKGLVAQDLYIPTVLTGDLDDVIHVTAKYPIDNDTREIFFFREGAVVFWNVPHLEQLNVFRFLEEYQDESYSLEDVEEEQECMQYSRSGELTTRLLRGKVILGSDPTNNNVLEKYAFSNAMASSVKLGIWESTLEKFVDGIEHISEALKRGEAIKLSRAQVLQRTGELFALRHQLKLTSDLQDTPDFYWERERLETLYQKTCDYLSLYRRTKVMNDKLTECCELLDLISGHLTDEHHTRLEWMIIVLIMIEVGFEILHLLERYELIQI